MTETSNTPSSEISTQFIKNPDEQTPIYVNVTADSTTVSLHEKASSPLRRDYTFRQGATARSIRVAYSEKQASQGRRREEINRRLRG